MNLANMVSGTPDASGIGMLCMSFAPPSRSSLGRSRIVSMPKAADHRGLVAGDSREMMNAPMPKSCARCDATEWPCFLVDALCRMCQARRRDEQRQENL